MMKLEVTSDSDGEVNILTFNSEKETEEFIIRKSFNKKGYVIMDEIFTDANIKDFKYKNVKELIKMLDESMQPPPPPPS